MSLIGNKPNQVPTNGDLGSAAYVDQDRFYSSAVSASNRNRIINGDMRVAQRGTSFTAQGYTLDRWYQQLSGGTATLTQETFPLGSEVSGCSNYLKQVTSVGNDYCGLLYKVEDVRSLPQGTATISFFAKGTNPAAGSFQLAIYRMHDGFTVHDTLLNTTITVTTSWQRFTHSFTVPTLAGMSTPTANSLIYISLRQAEGDTSTAAWELNLTGVQLEAGSVATPFEHRQYGQELALCQRYCYVDTNESSAYRWFAQGYNTSSTQASVGVRLPVTMRTAPSGTPSSQTAFIFDTPSGAAATTAISVNGFTSAQYARLSMTCSGGVTTAQPIALGSNGSSNRITIVYSAEL